MVYENAKVVYNCCGRYIVPTNACKDKKIYCSRCGELQTKPVTFPKVVIVKS